MNTHIRTHLFTGWGYSINKLYITDKLHQMQTLYCYCPGKPGKYEGRSGNSMSKQNQYASKPVTWKRKYTWKLNI